MDAEQAEDSTNMLRPIEGMFRLMKVSGIYINYGDSTRRLKIFFSLYAALAWALSLIEVVRVVVFLAPESEFGSRVVDKSVLLVAYSAALMVYSTSFFTRNYFGKFCRDWETLIEYRMKVGHKETYGNRLRKIFIIIVILSVVVPLGVCVSLMIYTIKTDQNDIVTPVWTYGQNRPFYLAMNILLIIFW